MIAEEIEELYTYEDMVRAVLEERDRIITILSDWESYWGNSNIDVENWWKIGGIDSLVELLRKHTPKPSDTAMAKEQSEDEMLCATLELHGQRIVEEEEEIRLEADRRAAEAYESDGYGRIDDHTSVWGRMGGPDCCTQPVLAGI